MKIHSKIIIALLSPFFVLGFSACTNDGKKEMSDSASELGKDIKNEADRIGDSTAAALDKAGEQLRLERDELSAKLNKAVEKIDLEIEETDAKMGKFAKEEKARWKVRRAKLEEQRVKLKQNLTELQQDTKREWNEFKARVNKAIEEIDKDLQGK